MKHCQGISPINYLHIEFLYVHASISRLMWTPFQIHSKISLSFLKMKLLQKSLESEMGTDFQTTPYLIMHTIITLFAKLTVRDFPCNHLHIMFSLLCSCIHQQFNVDPTPKSPFLLSK